MKKFENGLDVVRQKFELIERQGTTHYVYINPHYKGGEICKLTTGAYLILSFLELIAIIDIKLLEKIEKIELNFVSYSNSYFGQDRSYLYGDQEFLSKLIKKAYYRKYGIESFACLSINKEALFELAKENNVDLSNFNLKIFDIFD
jgi:hypothetical protein